MPVWDELTYYPGRYIDPTFAPFMFYLTAFAYALLKGFGFSLLSVASYMSAIYGALIVFPMFFLVKELSNKYGGLLAATLAGAAPQILIRTFGSSYDTDQLALFFIVLTLYFGYLALTRKNISSYTLAITGFIAFMLSWGMFAYTFYILIGFCLVYLFVRMFTEVDDHKHKITFMPKNHNIKKSTKDTIANFKSILIIFLGILVGSIILKMGNWETKYGLKLFWGVIDFAFSLDVWIVNISIAELQPFSIFSMDGWMLAMGRFVTGLQSIDVSLFLIFISLIGVGLYYTYKKDLNKLSFLLTLLTVGVFSTLRGIRFTEFTSVLFIIIVATGFGWLVNYCSKEKFLQIFALGLGLSLIFIACGIGMSFGSQLGPDVNSNWDNAWTFLRDQTPELSIIGTWWDPGHMISALSERRNFADGAHCAGDACLYTINDRIVDLGKIMATSNEDEALQLIKKYQGTSPKVYWIASDDLIGKFRWLQYFGTGCDGTTNVNCPLYMQVPRTDVNYNDAGYPTSVDFQTVKIMLGNVPVPIIIQGKTGIIPNEVIFYDQEGSVNYVDLSSPETLETMKSFESQIGVTISGEVAPLTIWIPVDYSAITVIPQSLRNSVFTRMFFLEGMGLEHFKQVYRNEQVKIYEVV